MKYVIMADGKGSRWNNYNEIPKHLAVINGETIIGRTVRLLNEIDSEADIIITSHDPRYDIKGSKRYEPKNNVLEIDRFTSELIGDNMVFLYGDTYYTVDALKEIVNKVNDDLLFFGNEKSIVAIKVTNGTVFKKNVDRVRELFLKGEIEKCIGWQVYQSFTGLPFMKKQIGEKFVVLTDETDDINSPEDYEKRGL